MAKTRLMRRKNTFIDQRKLDAAEAALGAQTETAVVDALRQPVEHDRLKTFLSWALPATVLSTVVAAELKAGARTPNDAC